MPSPPIVLYLKIGSPFLVNPGSHDLVSIVVDAPDSFYGSDGFSVVVEAPDSFCSSDGFSVTIDAPDPFYGSGISISISASILASVSAS